MVASRRVLIGQPVLIDAHGSGVLRIALSAHLVALLAEDKSCKNVIVEDEWAIEKVELIAKNFNVLRRGKAPG